MYTIDFSQLGMKDIEKVGGKNASLGEMISNLSKKAVSVPAGFATTADAYRAFLSQNGLDEEIKRILDTLDTEDMSALTLAGKTIRAEIIETPFLPEFEQEVLQAYEMLTSSFSSACSVAVRSSATAEDLPNASFAGQQETILNVRGGPALLLAIKEVFASLYNDRAIAYRVHNGFVHHEVALSVGVQQMIRSDLAVSGVMFTLDTESGFSDVVFITASYGLGELLVQGAVNPDEFYLHKENLRTQKSALLRRNLGSKAAKMVYADALETGKTVAIEEVPIAQRQVFSLTLAELEELARQAMLIEEHYQKPMDIEWAKDGIDGKLYILQARPETVKSRSCPARLERYSLEKKGKILVEGRSIGQRIGQGKARIIRDVQEIEKVQKGDILVSDMTDPDWEPVMKKAAAIVTNRGGRTCHAAIIARELGIPAVVGCIDATQKIQEGQEITVSCAEGDTGYVYQDLLPFSHSAIDVDKIPPLPIKVMLNVGNPDRAFAFQAIPNAGVGLARLEFLISNTIGIHPKALLQYHELEDPALKALIDEKTAGYPSRVEYYIERLKEGIATIAAAFVNKPVIVRLSDFKSNEYANLLGGSAFEPKEENPMLGYRGACRYLSQDFKACFALECQAIKRVREEMGFTNVEVMIPFVRTVQEAKEVIDLLRELGLKRGERGLRIIMMCEIPSNALLAEEFLAYFDGFSVGSNDLTQLTLGLDRDSGLVASQFDERNDAVKTLLHMAISACKSQGKYIGICGQGPSDHPDFAEWLMQEGIDSVSLNPDSVLETCLFLSQKVIK